ncbi:MAG TPA: DUF6179 domain-containing protein [Ruminiclostridium sp.]|nr:DUF6179 domain-containing protein [Ruminiclostridium sp.]
MDKIQRYQHIHPVRGEYLQSLLQGAAKAGLIGASQVKKIQVGLLNLLSRQIEKFTFGESSSVKAETAQSLLQSICFSIGLALKNGGDTFCATEMLEKENVDELFNKGNELIKYYLNDAKRLWSKIKAESPRISNLAYNDTIFEGIKEFFNSYDWRFTAHITNGSIDYPLSYDEMDLTGVEYIHEYLSHLDMENTFCSRYDAESIDCLMRGYSKHFEEDLINVYELVLTNLLGRSILGCGLNQLDISKEEREILSVLLYGQENKEIEAKLENAFYDVINFAGITDANVTEYLKKALNNISARIKQNKRIQRLDRIFITLKEEEKETGISGFVDGSQMEDEDLRLLIDEIKDCRYVSDKVAMVSNSVKSLSDLIEVLNECFFEGEYNNVFKLLDKPEIIELKKRVLESQTGPNPEYDWQNAFLLWSGCD